MLIFFFCLFAFVLFLDPFDCASLSPSAPTAVAARRLPAAPIAGSSQSAALQSGSNFIVDVVMTVMK